MYVPYILDKVQKSRIDAVVNPTKYFRDVATLDSILCDVNCVLYSEIAAETDW